jgi:23S rRNA U2552 (ribose-2'-O)-methylase RlmE/FtsJ
MQIISHIFNENRASYESDISVLASHFEGKNVANIKKFFAEYFKFMTKNKIKTFNHHSIGMFINEEIT